MNYLLQILKFIQQAIYDEFRFNFSRNMAGEPTRLFMGLSPTDVKVNSTNLNSIVGQYIVPGLPFFKSKEERDEDPYGSPYTLGFTRCRAAGRRALAPVVLQLRGKQPQRQEHLPGPGP